MTTRYEDGIHCPECGWIEDADETEAEIFKTGFFDFYCNECGLHFEVRGRAVWNWESRLLEPSDPFHTAVAQLLDRIAQLDPAPQMPGAIALRMPSKTWRQLLRGEVEEVERWVDRAEQAREAGQP